jgi:hypothetical protein
MILHIGNVELLREAEGSGFVSVKGHTIEGRYESTIVVKLYGIVFSGLVAVVTNLYVDGELLVGSHLSGGGDISCHEVMLELTIDLKGVEEGVGIRAGHGSDAELHLAIFKGAEIYHHRIPDTGIGGGAATQCVNVAVDHFSPVGIGGTTRRDYDAIGVGTDGDICCVIGIETEVRSIDAGEVDFAGEEVCFGTYIRGFCAQVTAITISSTDGEVVVGKEGPSREAVYIITDAEDAVHIAIGEALGVRECVGDAYGDHTCHSAILGAT